MITVLRLGHRRGRDDRISTHVGLTARQFGADSVIYSGAHDEKMMESLRDLGERWGGDFTVQYREDWRNVVNEFPGVVVHLTMYGIPLSDKMPAIRDNTEVEDLLIIVGGEKVPADVFEMADHNVAVGNQPHSEVAALAVFLHDRFEGEELDHDFSGAQIRVVPQDQGKKTVES